MIAVTARFHGGPHDNLTVLWNGTQPATVWLANPRKPHGSPATSKEQL